MQSLNPGEFTRIYALQVILGTTPSITQEEAENIIKTAVIDFFKSEKMVIGVDGNNLFLFSGSEVRFYVDTGEFNVRGKDSRSPMHQLEDGKRADEFSEKGTLKHYLLRKGFYPNNEADAEAILDRIIHENEANQV